MKFRNRQRPRDFMALVCVRCGMTYVQDPVIVNPERLCVRCQNICARCNRRRPPYERWERVAVCIACERKACSP